MQNWLKVEDATATIFLPRDEMQIFWERNINGMLLAAGFEIYDTEIKAHYVFTKVEEADSQVDIYSEPTNSYQQSPSTIPYSETGLKEKYTFDNFVQGMVMFGLSQQL